MASLIDNFDEEMELPFELLLRIFEYVPPKDLLRGVLGTCHTWKIAADDNLLWRTHCIQEGIPVYQESAAAFDWREHYKARCPGYFVWDVNRKGLGCRLSPECKKTAAMIMRDTKHLDGLIIANKGFSEGTHYWEINNGNAIRIGVYVNDDFDIDCFSCLGEQKDIYSSLSGLLSPIAKQHRYAQPNKIKKGDFISVELQIRGEDVLILYTLNGQGEPRRTSCRKLNTTTTFYPAVRLLAPGTRVTLLKYEERTPFPKVVEEQQKEQFSWWSFHDN